MSLSQEERNIMIQLEIERSNKMMAEFPIYIANKLWSTLVNRMYYAVFHAATALLIKHSLHASTHQGLYVLLSKYFVKTGVLSNEEGRLFARLETMREKSDYNCYLESEADEVMPLLEPTKELIFHLNELSKK
ncbi:MAG: HEPN domain-containing protein [Paludibacteraceae bacterium]|nr:HEPN domain-containing protein [Paludibacteraceae bacterium]